MLEIGGERGFRAPKCRAQHSENTKLSSRIDVARNLYVAVQPTVADAGWPSSRWISAATKLIGGYRKEARRL
jgi:hypothetical protein